MSTLLPISKFSFPPAISTPVDNSDLVVLDKRFSNLVVQRDQAQNHSSILSDSLIAQDSRVTQLLSIRNENELCTAIVKLAKQLQPQRTDTSDFEQHFANLRQSNKESAEKLQSFAKLELSAVNFKTLLENSLNVKKLSHLPQLLVDSAKEFDLDTTAFEDLCTRSNKMFSRTFKSDENLEKLVRQASTAKSIVEIPAMIEKAAKPLEHIKCDRLMKNAKLMTDTYNKLLELHDLVRAWITNADCPTVEFLDNLQKLFSFDPVVYHLKRVALESSAIVTLPPTQPDPQQLASHPTAVQPEKQATGPSHIALGKRPAVVTPTSQPTFGTVLL